MKSKIFFLSIILCLFQGPGSKAQQYSREFGKVSVEELSMIKYPADTEAAALVLYDKGLSKFIYDDNGGFDIYFTESKRIKILKPAGKRYSEIEIPFYREGDVYENIKDLEAYTYNLENGRIVIDSVTPSLIYDEKENDRWNEKKFAFPDVKEGSVLEYRYTLITPYIFRLPDWEFQDNIPTLYSEYIVHMVPFYQYTWLLQGANKFDIYKSVKENGLPTNVAGITYNDMVSTYGMINVPAFHVEDFLTCRDDYIIKLNFQLMAYTDIYGVTTKVTNTWDQLIKDLLNHPDFGKYINAAGRASKRLVDYDTLKNLDPEVRFNKILDFVKANYSWNGNQGFYTTKSAGKFASEKSGNCADVNLFLCGMLQQANLNAFPVILSTRDHGIIKYDYPYINFFNYDIVMVDLGGKNVLADATDLRRSNTLIPAQCLNDKGLVVDKSAVKWVKLASDMQSQITHIFVIKPQPQSDSLNVFFRIKANNYDGLNLRKIYAGKQKNLADHLRKDMIEPADSIQVKNYDNVEKPFLVSLNGKYPARSINGKLYIKPFLDEPVSENPFKYKTRSYPIDMNYPRTRIFISQIEIPKGYKVESLPENRDVLGDLVVINYKIDKVEDKLMVSGSYKFTQAVYKPEDYLKLKAYYDIIIKKFNEKIVLAPVQ